MLILLGGTADTSLQLPLPAVLRGVTFLWGACAFGLRADNMTRKQPIIYTGPAVLLLYIVYFIQLK